MVELSAPQRRLEALRGALEAEGLAGAILSRPQHLFYFTGAMPGPGPAFLVVLPRRAIAVAQAPLGDLETVTYTGYDIHRPLSAADEAAAALRQALDGGPLTGRAAGVELADLPASFMAAIAGQIGAPRDIAALLWRLRRIKDAGEVARIEANVAANDRVFQALRGAVQPGRTEIDLWAAVYHAMCREAGGPITLEADLGAGLRSGNPDAKPGPERLLRGEGILVDIYSATHGYYADTTRVFTVGPPTARQREIHGILEEALAAGEAALRPGAPACAVDAAVRGVIERAGYGPNFPHHSGHAYGIFQQERPYLIPGEPLPLEQGMILTLEPGIYIPGWGGMRLEGNYVLTAEGARSLDRFPRQLVVC